MSELEELKALSEEWRKIHANPPMLNALDRAIALADEYEQENERLDIERCAALERINELNREFGTYLDGSALEQACADLVKLREAAIDSVHHVKDAVAYARLASAIISTRVQDMCMEEKSDDN